MHLILESGVRQRVMRLPRWGIEIWGAGALSLSLCACLACSLSLSSFFSFLSPLSLSLDFFLCDPSTPRLRFLYKKSNFFFLRILFGLWRLLLLRWMGSFAIWSYSWGVPSLYLFFVKLIRILCAVNVMGKNYRMRCNNWLCD